MKQTIRIDIKGEKGISSYLFPAEAGEYYLSGLELKRYLEGIHTGDGWCEAVGYVSEGKGGANRWESVFRKEDANTNKSGVPFPNAGTGDEREKE